MHASQGVLTITKLLHTTPNYTTECIPFGFVATGVRGAKTAPSPLSRLEGIRAWFWGAIQAPAAGLSSGR